MNNVILTDKNKGFVWDDSKKLWEYRCGKALGKHPINLIDKTMWQKINKYHDDLIPFSNYS